MVRRLLLLSVLLVSGCAWGVRDATDQTVRELVEHPFDVAPDAATDAPKPPPQADASGITPSNARLGESAAVAPEARAFVETTAWIESQAGSSRPRPRLRDDAVQTVAWTKP